MNSKVQEGEGCSYLLFLLSLNLKIDSIALISHFHFILCFFYFLSFYDIFLLTKKNFVIVELLIMEPKALSAVHHKLVDE